MAISIIQTPLQDVLDLIDQIEQGDSKIEPQDDFELIKGQNRQLESRNQQLAELLATIKVA